MTDAPDPRRLHDPLADQVRTYTQRSGAVAVAGAVAGLLMALVAPGAPSPGHALWLLALLSVVGLRLAVARARRRDPDGPPGPWRRRLRAMALLHGACWGTLPWVGPLPTGPDELAVLVQLQVGVAVGGMALLLHDPRTALGFALLAGLPLALRLLALPPPVPLLLPVAALVFLLLTAGLYVAARRTARERRQLALARAAEAERDAEARRMQGLLRQVFDHVGVGIALFDRELRAAAVNAHLVDLIGLDPALAVPGTPLRDWVLQLARAGAYGPAAAADPQALATRRLAELARPEPEVLHRRQPDGRTLETRRTPLPEGGFALVCVDVTERLASEAALFENRRTLDLLLENTEEGFWFIDAALRTTDANRAMCRMLGVDRAALLGRSIYDFVDAENEAIFRHQTALRSQGLSTSYEIALRRADGTLVHCWNNATPIHDGQGRRIGAIGLFSDISERKRAEARLAEQTQLLASTLEALSQGVLTIAPDGRLRQWNTRLLELLQVDDDRLRELGTLPALAAWQVAQGHFGPRLELMPGDREREGLLQNIAGTHRGRPPSELYRRRRLDGRVLEIRLHRSPDGNEVRTFTDVTAEVEAERALIAARDLAERASRAKSEFLSRMSHELRTPLNAILGFGQLMLHDAQAPLPPPQRARADQVMQGGQLLLALVDGLLDVARIEGEGAGATPAPPPPAPQRRRVLYVEDNEVNRLLMQGMFAHRPDLELQLAEDPQQGLALAAQQPPDLVLLDIQLPGMDGHALLRALRALPGQARLRAVAVSANALPEHIGRARDAGFDGYLTKPIDLDRLWAAVDAGLAARR